MTPYLDVALDASIRISAVALTVGIALLVGKVRSSSLQHAAWLAVLCAMPLMPLLPRVVPGIEVPAVVTASEPGSAPALTDAVEVAPVPASESPAPTVASAPRVVLDTPLERPAPVLPRLILLVYGLGAVLLLWRLIAGWFFVRRVLRSSRQVRIEDTTVYESALVSTPVTVGLKKHHIILPLEWTGWPDDKLRAVLAHESAHVLRHDTVISFLAHLNRCVFWFHPLAWWLDRQLAVAAEHACDDAGVRAIGESRRYAEVLLDMAEAVRRRGNRLVCQGVGADGTGLLGRRIDRVLRGGSVARVTATQKMLVGCCSAAAIFLAAGCREKSAFSGVLKPNPEYTATVERSRSQAESFKAARELTAEQVAGLEAAVRQNPEDLESRRKLMIFYQSSGRKVLGDQKTIAGFWPHKLWLIQHHPENELASTMEPLSDPASYEQGKKLWLGIVAHKDAPPSTLMHAASFFERTDPRRAEELLLRAQTAKPDERFSSRLGRFYASVLAGNNSKDAYGQELRKKLAESKDPVLLASTGFMLALNGQSIEAANDLPSLAQSYLERALELDPNSTQAQNGLGFLRAGEDGKRLLQALGKDYRDPSEEQYRKVATLPEADRFDFLPRLAAAAYIYGDIADYHDHDQAKAKSDWELARRYAQDALKLAPRFVNAASYSRGVHLANMALGMIAIRVDGKKKAATQYLLAASETLPRDNTVGEFTMKLPVLLLKYGGPDEREAVVEFLERYGKVLHRSDFDPLLAAKQIRAGTMPIWYQYQAAQLQ
jgi:beta-lactamase regulating signal transducer with metallopeptidase domain